MADNGEEKQEQIEQACIFFRKPLKNLNLRRKTYPDDEDEASSVVVMKKKKPTPPDNKLHFATDRWYRSEESKKASMFQFSSSNEIQVHNDSSATATLETETEFSRDARSIRERILKRAEEALKGKGKLQKSNDDDHKLYKGINAYTDHKAGFRREQTVSNGFHGPLRAPVHIRTSARFDYQPDVCKDYKQTGYCGYGDSCKFLHDRGDFKSGWQLEKEWNESEKERKRKLAFKHDDDHKDDVEDDHGLPFACFICRHPFVNPVVTKCKHYFCEKCALKHHRKKMTCYVCNRPTLGIFNTAHEIRRKMMDRSSVNGKRK